MEDWVRVLILFAAGVFAGGLNALAGGGGFITLPALVFSGLTPLLANVGGTVAVWPGIVASLFAYRKNLKPSRYSLGWYLAVVLLGSAIGAVLLLYTTNRFFVALLPYLLLFATLLFIFGRSITAKLSARHGPTQELPPALSRTLMFLIAVYGGYFGGGMGIMTLAVLALMGMDDIHEMNALKTVVVLIINTIGMIIFAWKGMIHWHSCLVMMAGCAVGGYGAGTLVQKVNPIHVRKLIGLIAASMTTYFFYKAYF